MDDRELRVRMDIDSKRFYADVFTTALCNIYAVRNGLFGDLLCESTDPAIHKRWEMTEPGIVQAMTGGYPARRGDA